VRPKKKTYVQVDIAGEDEVVTPTRSPRPIPAGWT